MAVGAGYYSAAGTTTAIALVALGPLRMITWRVVRRYRGETGLLLVQLPAGTSPAPVIEAVESPDARLESLEITQDGERRNLQLTLELRGGRDGRELIGRVADVEGVQEVRWAD
jgi:uncharacterized membrane protein YhiD involved in acid resistance